MQRPSDDLLRRMGESLSEHDRDEMAIPSYLHRIPAMRWMAWRRGEVVADRLNAWRVDHGAGRRIVDFGCGSGVLLRECRAAATEVFGIDLELGPAQMLLDAWSIDGVTLMTPDEADKRIEPNSVDVIIAAEVLEHLEDKLPAALATFHRWLKPDGRFIVSLPTENELYRLGRRLAGFSGHYHHDNAASIDEAIRAQRYRRLGRWMLPLPGPLAIYWVCEYAP